MEDKNVELTKKAIERFWSKVDKKSEDECWGWKGAKTTDKYGLMRIKYKTYLAHRISWTIHNGEIPTTDSYKGVCVCHKCDTPLCVNPSHLFLGTQKENMKDKKWKGRGARGEKHGRHKLTEKEVVEIREKYIPRKYTMQQLAEEYSVSLMTICFIVKLKTWKHL